MSTRSHISEHNEQQRAYFETIDKPRMLPAETPYIRRQVEELLRCAGIGPDDRILEVGCGMGRYTLDLARRGLNIEGLDLSPVLLDRLRAFGGGRYGIPLHCADILESPPSLEGCFDAVIGFFTLHHLHDLEASFAAMRRLLKPGGRLAFLEPNAYNPLYYVQIVVTPGMSWKGDGGMVRMRRSVVFRALERAGFENLRLDRFGFFPPFLANRPRWARLELWLERAPLWRPALPFQIFQGVNPPR